ncbi:hypothetical protein ACOR62_07740 [Neisseria lisongii]|uniref:DUF4124 domain-containing protein n=1 Tax=Neisseria lisongii TaxID=2912188 RepID=A0AAW5ANF0_9NEIS|nr:hypothetical protein [Neisseria lisongii]MCF7529682.1 hypothetical protein [Neisseria lisongii]
MSRPLYARCFFSAALFCAAACAQAADVYRCPQRGAPLYTTEPAAPCLNHAELPAISSYSSGDYKLDTPSKTKAEKNETKKAKRPKTLSPAQEQTDETATRPAKRQKNRRRPNPRSAK